MQLFKANQAKTHRFFILKAKSPLTTIGEAYLKRLAESKPGAEENHLGLALLLQDMGYLSSNHGLSPVSCSPQSAGLTLRTTLTIFSDVSPQPPTPN